MMQSPVRSVDRPALGHRKGRWLAAIIALGITAMAALPAGAAETAAAAAEFRKEIQPILQKYCYDCHGDGAKKGQVAFDKLETDSQITNPALWYKALKNVRAGLMPPPKKARPSSADQEKLEHWIKYGAFGIDPKNPDPGRVTIRRLNRTEYRNSIRDLLGIDLDVNVLLPPDDVGYGFDNIGDVLSISPMRMEKFIEAAMTAAEKGIPMDTVVIPTQMALPKEFLTADGKRTGDALTFYKVQTASKTYQAMAAGDYRIHIAAKVDGESNPDPQLMRIHISSDDKEFFTADYKWSDAEFYDDERVVHWEAGDHQINFTTQPLKDLQPLRTKMDYRIMYVRVDGPLDRAHWEHPPGFSRFYTREAPPTDAAERRAYAREVLGKFAPRAFRRPVDDQTLDQLVALAEKNYSLPGVPFEKGVAQAMVAVLSSPRFLFHMETAEALATGQTYSRIDEYTLASRLSFALWCSIPDDELLQVAGRGELRKNFDAHVKRMLADPKAQAFAESFSNQWLQTRSVLDIPINSVEIMAKEGGPATAPATPPVTVVANINANGTTGAAVSTGAGGGLVPTPTPATEPVVAVTGARGTDPAGAASPAAPARGRAGRGAGGQAQTGRFGRGRGPSVPPGTALTPEIRLAMKQEVEAYFSYIMRDNRSVLEFIRSDYTFVNEALAPIYGISNIAGPDIRQVQLPPGDLRGGVLTMGSVLTVTSNPTRTSPVKRGKWILENILGSPPAPPPPNIPALEDTKTKISDHPPTQRELLAIHREDALCSSCHARMDPPGLAMESFNAFGRLRTSDNAQPIDPAGELATGEKFTDVRGLKQALADKHRLEFYRTLTEKMLTYVLGRGIEYYDVQTVDSIVERMEKEDGRFSALLLGALESAPFQLRRQTPHAINPETASQN